MSRQLETPYRFQPTRLETPSLEIIDVIAQISSAVERLGRNLHPKTAGCLNELVVMMNCYYTNLIEGHHTKPRDIERALAGDFDKNKDISILQFEAKKHIELQIRTDVAYSWGVSLPEPESVFFIKLLHESFFLNAPAEMLHIKGDGLSFIMVPGEFRKIGEPEVSVGKHSPPSGEVVADFMENFAEQYKFSKLGLAQKILAIPAAHHRFNYIHPFHDGNGRVSRLMSHAMAHHAGIAAHGLWSISRGLARGLKSASEYKAMMERADMPRQGSSDGRGNLSEKALSEFTLWFLQVCLDQIIYMTQQFDLSNLTMRFKRYIEINKLAPESFNLLERAMLYGSFERGEASRLTGLHPRTAQRILSELTRRGLLKSDSPKSAVYLNFPVDSLDILFPSLFLEL